MNRAQRLLQLAVPLVRTHGFTRAALVEAAFSLHHHGAQLATVSTSEPTSESPTASSTSTSTSTSTTASTLGAPGLGVREADAALDALFGAGADAPRKALVQAWLEAGVKDMGQQSLDEGTGMVGKIGIGMDADVQRRVGEVLKRRLRWNEPVLRYLPEVWICLLPSCFIGLC